MQLVAGEMEKDAQLVMRIPAEMQDRLREYAEKLSRDFGLPVSMAAGARRLLNEALERAGLPEAQPSGSTKKAAKKKGASVGRRNKSS